MCGKSIKIEAFLGIGSMYAYGIIERIVEGGSNGETKNEIHAID
jgi:hypothetical protein